MHDCDWWFFWYSVKHASSLSLNTPHPLGEKVQRRQIITDFTDIGIFPITAFFLYVYRFHAVARSCLTDVSRTHCGTEAGVFVNTVLSGLTPPYCHNNYPEYMPADTTFRTIDQPNRDRNTNTAFTTTPPLFYRVLMVFILLLTWHLFEIWDVV